MEKTNPSNSGGDGRLRLDVSAFDRVVSLVIALLVMIGSAVVCLLIIWLSSNLFEYVEPVPVKLMNLGGGGIDGVAGESLQLDASDLDEISEETDLLEPELQETMDMVLDLAMLTADIDNPIFNEDLESHGSRSSQGTGKTRGLGEGTGDGGQGPIWEMQYDDSTLAVYARQLDFFGIELAVVGGAKDGIEYASGFSNAKPSRRSGTRDQEIKREKQRTYFTHRSGTVEKYDLQLLARAGIKTKDKIILQYYTDDAERQLLLLQRDYRRLEQPDILKTVFGIRRDGAGFKLFVVDQIRR